MLRLSITRKETSTNSTGVSNIKISDPLLRVDTSIQKFPFLAPFFRLLHAEFCQ